VRMSGAAGELQMSVDLKNAAVIGDSDQQAKALKGYIGQIEATRRGLLARLGVPNREVLGYQSRTGPVTWIGPGTDDLLRELGREGVKDVLVVPLSFVSDHIETLYEVDILFAGMAREAGITGYRRPAALNIHPLFIEALARLVERHLSEAAS